MAFNFIFSIRRAWYAMETRRQLHRLSTAQLQDIGMTRDQIDEVVESMAAKLTAQHQAEAQRHVATAQPFKPAYSQH